MTLLLLFAASRRKRPPLPQLMGAAITQVTPVATVTDQNPKARVKRGNRSWT